MRAVRFLRPGVLEVCAIALPAPGPGQVLLRVAVAGICQTDVHIVAGHYVVAPPRVLGHELTGEVTDVGAGVGREWIGQLVGIQPATFCGACYCCVTGIPEQCLNFRCIGNTEDGGWAEMTTARVDQLVPLGDLTPEVATWLEPLACVVHGLAMVQPVGAAALVIGAGPMGLLATQALRALGARRVAIADVNPGKLALAAELGADVTSSVPRTGPTAETNAVFTDLAPFGFNLVVDTTGKPESLARATRWAARGATVVLLGVSRPEDRLASVSPADIFARELKIIGSSGSTPSAFVNAHRLLVARIIRTEPMVWRTVSLEQVPEVVRKLAEPGEKGKVLIDPSLLSQPPEDRG